MTLGDLRYIARSLASARWFTAGALLTFGVGIGLAVAVLAVTDRILFRALPFRDVDRLVTIHPFVPTTGQVYAMFPRSLAEELCRRSPAIEAIAFSGNTRPLYFEGPERPPLRLTEASSNILDVLGVRTVLGRTFSEEDLNARLRTVLLREEVWRTRFGGDRNILARRFDDGRAPIDVVGVLPAGFVNPSINWMTPSDGLILSSDALGTRIARQTIPAPFARLRAGVSAVDAQRQIAALAANIEKDERPQDRTGMLVQPMREGVFWNITHRSRVLLGGGILMWFIACTNLGTLMVARVKSREKHARVRLLLGATRLQVALLTIAEIVFLCLTGAALALIAAAWGLRGLAAVVPPSVGALTLTTLDARLVLIVFSAAFLGATAASVYPVWEIATLGRGDQGTSRIACKSGRWLLLVESLVGTVLVLAGAFALRSYLGLIGTDLGFAPKDLYTVHVGARLTAPAETWVEWCRDSLTAIAALPEVASASAVDTALGTGESGDALKDNSGRTVAARRIFRGYFDAMGTALVAGRLPSEAEMRSGASITVVNRGAAQLFWPSTPLNEVVGRTLHLEGDTERRVVGVAADTRERHAEATTPEVFFPASATLSSLPTFLIRTRSSQPPNAAALREIIRLRFGSDAVVIVSSVSRRLDPALRDPRFYAVLFTSFGLVSLLLSAVGLFALTSYGTVLRRREMAIRLALGATPATIQRTFVWEALRPVAIGVIVGSMIAYWSAVVFQPLLHNVNPRSLLMYCAVSAFFVLVAGAAAWRPARRAGEADPLVALRSE